jgi:putative nucleotidyltransferase with HDIG domain
MAHGAQSGGRFGSAGHLAGRFLGALAPRGPADADERWALAQLLPGEQELWRRMSGPDRRHAVAVARAALAALERDGQAPERAVAAAALLHDVGKVESDLGTLSRVAVTIAAVALGHRRLRGRAGLYVAHDRIGGKLLRAAGSDPLTIAWAEQHHLDPGRWTIDRRTAMALHAADSG